MLIIKHFELKDRIQVLIHIYSFHRLARYTKKTTMGGRQFMQTTMSSQRSPPQRGKSM